VALDADHRASLPTSVIAAFIAVWLCGFSLNFMSLLGLSLAIGVLIDDAIVVRENIVRHMEWARTGAPPRCAARPRSAWRWRRPTFSIVAVFVPVAFMPGVSGEWFRPFGLTVVASVLVSLFISFTLDPMLSAFWGDPPGHHCAPKTGISTLLARFNTWFDHQADRYGRVIAWALHHRMWMFVFAWPAWSARWRCSHASAARASCRRPTSAPSPIEVRTPSSSSLEYVRLKMEAPPPLARTLPETKATNSYGNRRRPHLRRHRQEHAAQAHRDRMASELREKVARLVGAEYVVLDDLNNGAQKPVQIRFSGIDARRLLELTNTYMDKLRKVPARWTWACRSWSRRTS
jgi:HAE1 family hydrophobic/amphiphilic exporter-1